MRLFRRALPLPKMVGAGGVGVGVVGSIHIYSPPDGHHVVSGSYDYTIRVWDALGTTVTSYLEFHLAAIDGAS